MFFLRALRVFVVRKMSNLNTFFHGNGLKGRMDRHHPGIYSEISPLIASEGEKNFCRK
jgi:hypothetical protein